jgi:putative component of membrane protein insertase Oxa1/YidC/SpoIIIJ protein YidD
MNRPIYVFKFTSKLLFRMIVIIIMVYNTRISPYFSNVIQFFPIPTSKTLHLVTKTSALIGDQ